MAAVGWLVAGLLVALALACGLGWLAARERRGRLAAEHAVEAAADRLGVATRSLESRDAELASLRISLILAQQEARSAAAAAEVAAVADPAVPGALVDALAALRERRLRGRAGVEGSLATADTQPDLSPALGSDLRGLAARESTGGSGRGGPG